MTYNPLSHSSTKSLVIRLPRAHVHANPLVREALRLKYFESWHFDIYGDAKLISFAETINHASIRPLIDEGIFNPRLVFSTSKEKLIASAELLNHPNIKPLIHSGALKLVDIFNYFEHAPELIAIAKGMGSPQVRP